MISSYTNTNPEIIKDCYFVDRFLLFEKNPLVSCNTCIQYSIAYILVPFSYIILIDLLLDTCYYVICYEFRISLLLTFVSTLTWMFGTWWVSLLQLRDLSSMIPPVVVLLFVLAKTTHSFCITVASSSLLLSTSLLFPHRSSFLLPSVLCSLLDSTFLSESWLSIVLLFLWKLPFIQLALALLFLLLSLFHPHWRRYALLLTLFLSTCLDSAALPAFSFAHLTQLLSLLICIESRGCSANEMILIASVLMSCDGSPLSGVFHSFSLCAAVYSAFLRALPNLRRKSVLHVVILLVIVVLDGMEAVHDVRIARSIVRWRSLWNLSSSIRSDIRSIREYVESHSLQESLFSFATLKQALGGLSEKDVIRQFWGNENEEVFLRNLPFFHVLLSPFDEVFVPCVGNDSNLYCALKKRLFEKNSYGLCLNVLPFLYLEYASSDSLFLIYSISYFSFC